MLKSLMLSPFIEENRDFDDLSVFNEKKVDVFENNAKKQGEACA